MPTDQWVLTSYHAAKGTAPDRVLLPEVQEHPLQICLRGGTGRVQADSRREGWGAARQGTCRIRRGRGDGPDIARFQLRAGPANGRDTVPVGFSKRSVKLIGAMSEGELYVRIVESANSETFKELLEGIRRRHPKLYMILDNTSYHKSQTINEYVKGTGGAIEPAPVHPAAKPDLNRVAGSQTAGRYFESMD